MVKSTSIQRANGSQALRQTDGNHSLQDSPKVQSPPSEQMMENGMSMEAAEGVPSIKRQDSFEMMLPELPKIDVHKTNQQISNPSHPESPISPLLTSDPKNERSHSQTFSRPQRALNQFSDMPIKQKYSKNSYTPKAPSFWRLAQLSFAEWLYALLGSIGAAIFGSFNPLLAYTIALIMAAYYRIGVEDVQNEVNKWCLVIACMGFITVLANFLQHFYFGIMGEKMTERVRRMMFSGK